MGEKWGGRLAKNLTLYRAVTKGQGLGTSLDYYEHNPWLLWGETEKKNTNSNQKNFLALPILLLLTTYTWQILVTALFMEGLIILNLKLAGMWQMSLMPWVKHAQTTYKAIGLDRISERLLKDSAECMAPILTRLFI